MLVYNRIFFGDFGCGNRIYANTDIAKNSLGLQRSLDLSQLKCKLSAHPIPSLSTFSIASIHVTLIEEISYIY